MNYYVYILRCEDNSVYTGIATDYIRRFNEHISGIGAKYTKFHKPIKIEFVCCATDKSSALKLEYRIKQLSKSKKEALILSPELIFSFCGEKINAENYEIVKNVQPYGL